MNLLQQATPITWLIVAGCVVLLALLVWGWRAYSRYRARRALRLAITSPGLEYLEAVLVPDGMGGVFHADFVLLTPRGILVVDVRDVPGNVFGGDQMNEWTVMDGAMRSTFVNPQAALYDRVAAIKALTGDAPVEGRIVFTTRARFPKGMPKWTVMVDSLGTEFPEVERAAMSEAAANYAGAWEQLKNAVTPSSLNQGRPISTA